MHSLFLSGFPRRWSKGAFEEGNEGNTALPALSALRSQQDRLAINTVRFLDGKPAFHCMVAGPSGSGKSWLLWESTLLAGAMQACVHDSA
jgi:predicted AAA+ superfamily ATPase